MARDASVMLHFGDAEYLFRLRIGQLLELQDKINRPRVAILLAAGAPSVPLKHLMGPGSMFESIRDFMPHELREVLRIGLTGGGMKPAAAEALLSRHFAGYSVGEAAGMAAEILAAAFAGEEAAPVGKAQAAAPAAEATAQTTAATGSTSASSTAAEPSSVSTPAPSTISASSSSPP